MIPIIYIVIISQRQPIVNKMSDSSFLYFLIYTAKKSPKNRTFSARHRPLCKIPTTLIFQSFFLGTKIVNHIYNSNFSEALLLPVFCVQSSFAPHYLVDYPRWVNYIYCICIILSISSHFFCYLALFCVYAIYTIF